MPHRQTTPPDRSAQDASATGPDVLELPLGGGAELIVSLGSHGVVRGAWVRLPGGRTATASPWLQRAVLEGLRTGQLPGVKRAL